MSVARNKLGKFSSAHLVIIRLSAIGDVVLATATLDFFLSYLREDQITWVGTEPSLSLLKDSYPDLNYYNFKENSYKIYKLRKVTHVFDLQGSFKSKGFSFLLFLRDFCSCFSVEKFYLYRAFLVLKSRLQKRTFLSESSLKEKEKLYQYELMVSCANRFIKEKEGKYRLAKPNLKPKTSLLSSNLEKEAFLAIAPGGSHATKRLPQGLLFKLIHSFVRLQHGKTFSKIKIVFLGDLRDKKDLEPLLRKLTEITPYLNLAGALSLSESASVLAKARILLTSDSALLHIAEAVETPVVSLFGPTSEKFGFQPFLEKSRSFSKNLSCRPCSKHGKAPCRFGDQLCFQSLEEDKIAKHLISFF